MPSTQTTTRRSRYVIAASWSAGVLWHASLRKLPVCGQMLGSVYRKLAPKRAQAGALLQRATTMRPDDVEAWVELAEWHEGTDATRALQGMWPHIQVDHKRVPYRSFWGVVDGMCRSVRKSARAAPYAGACGRAP
jgi:hypothetical protein